MDRKRIVLLCLTVVAVLALFTACSRGRSADCTVTFNSNGGTAVASSVVKYGKTVSRPSDPMKDGYIFRKWCTDPQLTSEYDFNSVVKSNITLYADWKMISVQKTVETTKAVEPEKKQESREGEIITIVLNSQKATTTGTSSISVEYGKTMPEITLPTKVGYVFGGYWTEKDGHGVKYYNADGTVTRNYDGSDSMIYALWIPGNDTAYTVCHFKEDSNNRYVLADTENLKGTTGAVVYASAKTYTGFSYDSEIKTTVANGNIAADGSLVLKLFYRKDALAVSFVSNGGTAVASKTAKYGMPVDAPEVPSKIGYTFAGWYKDSSLSTSWNFARDTVTEPITLYARWTSNRNTVYSIAHYLEDSEGNYVLQESENKVGATDTLVSALAKNYWGYTYDKKVSGTVSEGNILPDGSLVLKLYYTKNAMNIVFNSNGGSAVPSVAVKYGKTLDAPDEPVKTGYSFAGWFKDTTLTKAWDFADTVTSPATLYAKWVANTDTSYTVCHYKEDTDNKYVLADTESLFGTTGSFVYASAKSYAGFSYDSGIKTTVASGSVAADGSLVLKLFYKKNFLNIAFNSNGGSFVASKSVKYGTTVDAPADPSKTGYVFDGWYKEDSFDNKWNFANDAVMETTTVYAKWIANANTAYKVAHYLEADGKYVIRDTDELNGTTGSVVNAVARNYTGYTLDSTIRDTVASGKVTADGSLVLKLFYRKNFLNVTFDSNGGTAVAPRTVKYGSLLGSAETPIREGYVFRGWYKESSLANLWNFAGEVVNDSTTLYAKWEPAMYTITLERNGGKANGTASVAYNGNTAVINKDIARDGYSPLGFYSSPEGGSKVLNLDGTFASNDVEGYIENGRWYRTDRTTLYMHWFGGQPIGGRIFYVCGDNGATYEFYDANKELITGPQDVVGLANAVYYKIVSGKPVFDKFYVYDSTNAVVEDLQWGSYKSKTVSVDLGLKADGVGHGKKNTESALSVKDKVDGQTKKSLAIKSSRDSYETIWAFVCYMNGENGVNGGSEFYNVFGPAGRKCNRVEGCTDWYVGSTAEYDKLKESGLVNSLFSSIKMVWSSVEYNFNDSFSWLYLDADDCHWSNSSKGSICRTVLLRSF